jgi:hypothetical protein
MRERLRLLLTKKKAKCKVGSNGAGGTSGTGSISTPQAGAAPSPGTTETSVKPSTAFAAGTSSIPSAATTGPVLTKQDSSESLPQPVKDPRDLEALLDFIEGNQSSKCKDAKKAAKKARQKQKKVSAFVLALLCGSCPSFSAYFVALNNISLLELRTAVHQWYLYMTTVGNFSTDIDN